MKTLFADSFYFLAILNPDDQHHIRAMDFSRGNPCALVTTEWVLTEVGDALSSIGNREIFAEFIQNLFGSPAVIIVPASHELFIKGIQLYSERLDKSWSITDCISFLVMREHHLSDALSGDRHFEQAGFAALLK